MTRIPPCPTAYLLLAALLLAAPAAAVAEAPAWVAKSDANTRLVVELFARYAPEAMGQLGLEGLDAEVSAYSHEQDARFRAEAEELLATLGQRRTGEPVAEVRQDLDILIDMLVQELESDALEERLLLPYLDPAETAFRGIQILLDEQVAPERRPAALIRLRRYAGLEEGTTPLAQQAEAYIRARLGEPGLLGPYREEVELDLARAPRLLAGIPRLFETYEIAGYESAYAALDDQMAAYRKFIEEEVLPRSRDDYRLPPELYAQNLADRGIDMPVDELVSRAKVAFQELRSEMQALAVLVARERGFPSGDYHDVLRELTKEQLGANEILDHYRQRIGEVEAIIAREHIATLPGRPLRLRLATEAESNVVQAATIRWPQLLAADASDEVGEIILPLRRPATDGGEDRAIEDFTHRAASWSLVVHEGRPGHELQMASMLERGVSKARALFAFNSTNVEGWALYAEAEMKPYMPLDAQLVSLQHRLLRAARAFLDPGLQRGELTREQAMRILTEEVVLSQPLAEQEVERYTSRSPGQAPSYFCGYSRLLEIRAEAEIRLGDAFDRQAFNDFILGQGLLPPALLRAAVMEEFLAP